MMEVPQVKVSFEDNDMILTNTNEITEIIKSPHLYEYIMFRLRVRGKKEQSNIRFPKVVQETVMQEIVDDYVKMVSSKHKNFYVPSPDIICTFTCSHFFKDEDFTSFLDVEMKIEGLLKLMRKYKDQPLVLFSMAVDFPLSLIIKTMMREEVLDNFSSYKNFFLGITSDNRDNQRRLLSELGKFIERQRLYKKTHEILVMLLLAGVLNSDIILEWKKELNGKLLRAVKGLLKEKKEEPKQIKGVI